MVPVKCTEQTRNTANSSNIACSSRTLDWHWNLPRKASVWNDQFTNRVTHLYAKIFFAFTSQGDLLVVAPVVSFSGRSRLRRRSSRAVKPSWTVWKTTQPVQWRTLVRRAVVWRLSSNFFTTRRIQFYCQQNSWTMYFVLCISLSQRKISRPCRITRVYCWHIIFLAGDNISPGL